MENPELIRLANEFFEKAQAIDPSVTQVLIKCGDASAETSFVPQEAEEMKARFGGRCYWFPGIGVVCF